MPFTFAHPAFILPLQKLKKPLSLTSLIVGSIIPDFEFFLQLKEVDNVGHHFAGIFLFDLPLGILICFLYHNICRNLFIANLLPLSKLKTSALVSFNWNFYAYKNWKIVLLSLLIGILSHIGIDWFTHKDGFFVEILPFLEYKINIGKISIPLFYLLQIILSLFGIAIIVKWVQILCKKYDIKIKNIFFSAYWIFLISFFLILFTLRLILMPNHNQFWSVVMGFFGCGVYSLLLVSIAFKYSPLKKIAHASVTFAILFIPAILFSQSVKNFDKQELINKALEFRKDAKYKEAAIFLDSILVHNQNDAPILLFKGDLMLEAKQYSEAAMLYQKILPLQYEKTTATINLSYALFMQHKALKALKFAKMAFVNDKTNANAIVNYFNALLWNVKTKQASLFLQQQEQKISIEQKLVLKARLYTSSGNYKQGLIYYDSLLRLYPNKYYVQEYVGVLINKNEVKQATLILQKHDTLLNAIERNIIKDKLKGTSLQNVGVETILFKDVDNNIRNEYSIWYQQASYKKYRLRLSIGNALLESKDGSKTKINTANILLNEKWNRVLTGETNLNLQRLEINKGGSYNGITGRQSIKYQPNDRKTISLFVAHDILSFTATLLNKKIRSNTLGVITHLMLNGKDGLYIESSISALSDKNSKKQTFCSFYHIFKTEPTFKAGINFSALHFSLDKKENYFSPDKYVSTEAFVDYANRSILQSKFSFESQAAIGLQKLNTQKQDVTMRFQGQLNYSAKRYDIGAKYQISNVAAATGTGYKYNQLNIRFLWKW